MKIKKAKIENLNEIVELSSSSAIFHEKLNSYNSLDNKFKDILRSSLEKNINSSSDLILIAEEDNVILGYLLASKIDRLEMFNIKNIGLIIDIFIKENNRKKGIGELLVKESFNWFKKENIKIIEISITPENKSALKFWDNLNFKDFSINKYKKID
jgi:ribosomal protein S18 acetylase RimI-like enzyme